MTANVDKAVLMGVGKKVRNAYLQGKVKDEDILSLYSRNLKESDAFEPFGWTSAELRQKADMTNNPILRDRLLAIIEQKKVKAFRSMQQNALNMKKLEYYRTTALGMGLRPVMREVEKRAKSGDGEARILFLLMQTEFANLYAKKRTSLSEIIYQRKDILLKQVSDLLYDSGWECGISSDTGKNASYIIYIYLPDNSQVSWHCNDCTIFSYYDDIDCDWDGQPCSTMEKLLNYAHSELGIGTPLEKYDISLAS